MKDDICNIPNVLTFIRLLLVPVTAVLILSGELISAFITFLVACMTDLADGYIARRFDMMTRLGTWLDPLADKAMAIVVIVCFTIRGIVPLWVVLVVLVKELLMLAGGVVVLRKGYMTPSNKWGKIAALVLNISIASGFMHEYWYPYYLYAMYVAVIFVIVAFVQYAVKNGHYVFDSPADRGNMEKDGEEEE